MTKNDDENDRVGEPVAGTSASSSGTKRKSDGENEAVRKSLKKEESGAGDYANENEGSLIQGQCQGQDENEVGFGSAEADQEPEGEEKIGVKMKLIKIPWPYSLRTDSAEPLWTTSLTFQNWTIKWANFHGNVPLSLVMDQLANDSVIKITIPGQLGCHNTYENNGIYLRIWEGPHFWNVSGNDVDIRIPPGFDLEKTRISQNGSFVEIISPKITQTQDQNQDQD